MLTLSVRPAGTSAPTACPWSKGGLLDYDRESALYAPDGLFDLLQLIKKEGKVSRIIVISHSLGSEMVLGALFSL